MVGEGVKVSFGSIVIEPFIETSSQPSSLAVVVSVKL